MVLTGEDHSLSGAASDRTAQCWELGGEHVRWATEPWHWYAGTPGLGWQIEHTRNECKVLSWGPVSNQILDEGDLAEGVREFPCRCPSWRGEQGLRNSLLARERNLGREIVWLHNNSNYMYDMYIVRYNVCIYLDSSPDLPSSKGNWTDVLFRAFSNLKVCSPHVNPDNLSWSPTFISHG